MKSLIIFLMLFSFVAYNTDVFAQQNKDKNKNSKTNSKNNSKKSTTKKTTKTVKTTKTTKDTTKQENTKAIVDEKEDENSKKKLSKTVSEDSKATMSVWGFQDKKTKEITGNVLSVTGTDRYSNLLSIQLQKVTKDVPPSYKRSPNYKYHFEGGNADYIFNVFIYDEGSDNVVVFQRSKGSYKVVDEYVGGLGNVAGKH